MARLLGSESLGLYMLILPTFTLLISLSQFGLPIALAKLISEEKRNNKQLFFIVFNPELIRLRSFFPIFFSIILN